MKSRVQPRAGQVWRGRGSILGREIRITDVDDVYAWYDVIKGGWTGKGWRRIRLHSLHASYELSPAGGGHAVNGIAATDVEARAVASLHRLAERWPPTLKLVIVNGSVAVMRADAPVQAVHVMAVMEGMKAE